jgi:polyferredoxin
MPVRNASGAVLIGTAITGVLVFRDYDPFLTFFHFGKGVFWDIEEGHIAAFVITIAVLIGSVFISRIWCRYLCPLGATMNIFAWLGLTRIERDKNTCIDCKACDKLCPVRVKVSDIKTVRDVECINCNDCIAACPKSSLSLKIAGKGISVLTYIIASIAVFFLVIGIAKAAGIWKSIGIEKSSEGFTGDSIKGWMTMKDVAAELNMPAEELRAELGLPEEVDVTTPFKDINAKYGITFETETVRGYVDARTAKNHE